MNTENKLPEKFKKKLLKALRSGKYKQGRKRLHNDDDNTFCCLGVASLLAGDTKSQLGQCYLYPGSKAPDVLVGVPSKNDIVRILTEMNDEGKSFSEIADYIEQNL